MYACYFSVVHRVVCWTHPFLCAVVTVWVKLSFLHCLPSTHQTHPHCQSLISVLPQKHNILSTERSRLAQVGTSGNGGRSAVLPAWVLLNLFGISAAVLDVLLVCPDSICSRALDNELISCLCTVEH
jgi:hypothetical protein